MSEPFLGEVMQFGGNFPPRGWAFCNGQLLAISQNQALFSLLGTIYGGDGRTTFALPDLRGRVALHDGDSTGPGLSPRPQGQKSGQETVQLTAGQAGHGHGLQASTDVATGGASDTSVPAQSQDVDLYVESAPDVGLASDATSMTGSSQAHNNMAPTLAVSWIIAIQGLYPSRN